MLNILEMLNSKLTVFRLRIKCAMQIFVYLQIINELRYTYIPVVMAFSDFLFLLSSFSSESIFDENISSLSINLLKTIVGRSGH